MAHGRRLIRLAIRIELVIVRVLGDLVLAFLFLLASFPYTLEPNLGISSVNGRGELRVVLD